MNVAGRKHPCRCTQRPCRSSPVLTGPKLYSPLRKWDLDGGKEAACAVLPLMPSGEIIISTALLPESHSSKMKWDVRSMHCESHSGAIWRSLKDASRVLLIASATSSLQHAHGLVLTRHLCRIISLFDKLLSGPFYVCTSSIITYCLFFVFF